MAEGPDGDGDGDDTPIDMPKDASIDPSEPDAGPVDPGNLDPAPDNASTCPKTKPAGNSQCISFVGQCRYGPDIHCQCIAIGWLCTD